MKKYIELLKKQNIAYKIVTLFILTFICFFLLRVVKNTLVGLDFPNEHLEPANVLLTESFLNGNNPYKRTNIVPAGQEPPINFEYPFLHSIFAAAFSIILGGNTVAAHYLVSFLAMIISAFLGGAIVARYSKTTIGPTLSFLLLMFCHWRYGYITASPDGFGLFVTILTLYLAVKPSLKYREIWCAVGTIAAFYSKQYFAGICFSIFIFMLCYSKKQAFKYFVWCAILLALSMILITWQWPLFWVYSVLLLMYGCFHGWGSEGFIYVLEQMKYLAVVFGGMIAIIAVALIKLLKNKKLNDANETNAEVNKKVKKRLIKEGDALPLFLIQIPIQIVMLFIFGRNDGAYLTYFLQLLIPSIGITALILMEVMCKDDENIISDSKYENKAKASIMKLIGKYSFVAIYLLVVLFTIVFGWTKLPMHMYTDEDVANWQKAYAIIDEYREKGPVLHNNATAYYAIKHGDSTFGAGHNGDIRYDTYDEWKKSSLQQFLFPDAGAMYDENLKYREVIAQRVRDKEIALVICLDEKLFITDELLQESGYKKIETIPLALGNMYYEARFWVAE